MSPNIPSLSLMQFVMVLAFYCWIVPTLTSAARTNGHTINSGGSAIMPGNSGNANDESHLPGMAAPSMQHQHQLQNHQCEQIRVPLCEDAPYNLTRMPNMLSHVDQTQAHHAIAEFEPLMEIECSKNAKFFLCSIFTPMCTDTIDYPIVACRSVCMEVQRQCGPLLKRFGFPWPPMLNCTNFPLDETETVCMKPNPRDHHSSATHRNRNKGGRNLPGNNNFMPSEKLGGAKAGFDPNAILNHLKTGLGSIDKRMESGATKCNRLFVRLEEGQTSRNTASDANRDNDDTAQTATIPKCAPSCNRNIRFSRKDKEYVEIWMTIWASLCFTVTAFSVLTFFLDMSRFVYPERPIIFLSFCYLLYSLAYIIRLILKSERVSCTKDRNGCLYLIQGGIDGADCVVIFLLLYYFSMASAIWWVLLTFTWFLAAYRKWSTEAIAAYSSYFYLLAWGVPAIQAIAAIVTKKIDGDELTGLCYVGNGDNIALFAFVLAPFSLYVLLGTIFILVGFIGMFRIRTFIQKQPFETVPTMQINRLEKLMVRIGVFSLLYLVAACCLIGCYIYEGFQLQHWLSYKQNCGLKGKLPKVRVEMYMLKISMSLVVGITSGIWVFGAKTWHTWLRFFVRGFYFGRTKQPPRPGAGIPGGTGAASLPLTPVHHAGSTGPLPQQQYMKGAPSSTSYPLMVSAPSSTADMLRTIPPTSAESKHLLLHDPERRRVFHHQTSTSSHHPSNRNGSMCL